MRPDPSDHRLAARLVALALLAAVLCNGASVYLKRTGLVDGEAYRAYWSVHCIPGDPARAPVPAEPRCCARMTPEEIAQLDTDAHSELDFVAAGYIFETTGSEAALRLVKDLFGLALIAFSVLLVARRAVPAPAIREAWPVCALLGYAVIAFLVSLHLHGSLVAAVGLRAFMFAVLAVAAQWLVPHLGVIARCLGVLVVLQVLLLPFELFRGIHIHGHWSFLYLASRATGTMVQPNSLGIFAVTALAFFHSFSPARSWLAPLGTAALAAVFFSDSATGAVCAPVLLVFMLKDRIQADRRVSLAMAAVVAGATVAVALAVLSRREDLLYSQFGEGGRLDLFVSLLAERGLLETIFGSGLGTGKIAGLPLPHAANPDVLAAAAMAAARFTDSTLTGLLVEIGLLGTALFYATLAWAGLRDSRARPFYWVVALCSLTVNVTVFFPVNFMLGLAWAHSAWCARK
jgi:hypothetical protein